MQTSLLFPRSKAVLYLTVGLGLSLISVPAAVAVSTAIATASLSFSVSSPNGTVGFSSLNLNGTGEVNVAPPSTFHGYWNMGAPGATLSGSESIGVNSVYSTSSVNGRTFTATAGVSLGLPPYSTSDGKASSFNFVNLDTLHIVPVDGLFDLKFSSVHARLDLSLANDSDGVSAFGGASWFVSLRYSLPGDTDGGSSSHSLSKSIGTDGLFSDTSNDYNSFTFDSIPAQATNLQLYWETTAEAHAVDGTPPRSPLSVPEGGTSVVLLGAGLGAVEWLRRRLRHAQPAAAV